MATSISFRSLMRWLILGAGLSYSALQFGELDDDDEEEGQLFAESTVQVDANGLAADLRPIRVGPGGGFLVDLRDAEGNARSETIRAVSLDGMSLVADPLFDGRKVYQVPKEVQKGRNPVRVELVGGGYLDTAIEIKKAKSQRKIVRNIVGGVALLLFGLQIFTKGLRRAASRRLQQNVERLTHTRLGAMVLGFLLGPMAQTGASAAGVVLGFVESRLVRPVAALWMLWGALLTLSAAATLLPFVSFREALIVVGIGVFWLILSKTRRHRAFSQILLGAGLVFHGVYLTRKGFASLVSTPELLNYVGLLHTHTASGWLFCWLTGFLVAFVFQGPGALVVVVLGLLESLGLIGVPGAMAILIGAFSGTAFSALALTWAFGPSERRIVGLTTLLAFLGSLILLALQPALLSALDPWVMGDPDLAIWGKKQVLPHAASHLIVTYLVSLSVLGAISIVVAAFPRRGRSQSAFAGADPGLWIEHWIRGPAKPVGADSLSLRRDVLLVLAEVKAAIPETLRMIVQGDRQVGSMLESRVDAIRDASSAVMQPLRGHLATDDIAKIPPRYLRSTALTLFHIEHALDDVRRMADTFIERGELLRGSDIETLERVTGLLIESIDETVEAIREYSEIDLESIQEREIQINALELEHRRELVAGDQVSSISLRGEVLTAELVSGFENIGNQLYRLVQSLDGLPLADSETNAAALDDLDANRHSRPRAR